MLRPLRWEYAYDGPGASTTRLVRDLLRVRSSLPQLLADGHYFYTTWGDNRLGNDFHTNQPDVRFAKVPVGGPDIEGAGLVSGGGAARGAARSVRDAGSGLASSETL